MGKGRKLSSQKNKDEPAPKKQRTEAPEVKPTVKLSRAGLAGRALAFGQNHAGQLGLSLDIPERTKPAKIKIGEDDDVKIVDVCTGAAHTLCLADNGEVWSFGCNDEGALGRDTSAEDSECKPELLQSLKNVVQITAGDSHSAALLEDGQVFAWGSFRDVNGSMGFSTAVCKYQSTPTPVLPEIKIVKIASGDNHLVLLSSDGIIYTCGDGEQGQLGRVARYFGNKDSRKGVDSLITPRPVFMGKGKRRVLFSDCWAGAHVTIAKARDTGTVYVWGLNNMHQLGIQDRLNIMRPEILPNSSNYCWKWFSAGAHHTLGLTEDGQVFVMGRKEYGRLGLGKDHEDAKTLTRVGSFNGTRCSLVSASGCVSYALDNEGNLWSWGMGGTSQLTSEDDEDRWEPGKVIGKQLEGKKVVKASAGGGHTVMVVVEQ